MAASITCAICIDDKPSEEDWSIKMSPACDHERTCCDNCIRKHVKEELIQKNGFRDVPCLHSSCKATMTFDTLKIFASANDFERYDNLLFKRLVESMPEFRWCAASSCGWGAIIESGEENPIIHCMACAAKTCYIDRVLWHEGKTCRDYQISVYESEENANRNYINQNTKPCPSCNHGIEKIDGCDHMTCSVCQYEFCWRCSANYNGEEGIRAIGNTAHAPTCHWYM
ncbi:hypothetical protein P9112_014714 [Eukaryota sp. TZLM1-RC]